MFDSPQVVRRLVCLLTTPISPTTPANSQLVKSPITSRIVRGAPSRLARSSTLTVTCYHAPLLSLDQVKAALIDTPVVMVTGPRRCGKTSLVRGFTSHRYITLDDCWHSEKTTA